MGAETIAILMPIVVSLTQLGKWFGLRDRLGAVSVLVLSAAFVVLWLYSQDAYERKALFDYIAAWVILATSSAGIFGFTRAASDAVTSLQTPPAGAAQSPTVKE